ncbi:MAG: hypothetical protein K2Y13_16460 [Burkholderiaceae bacterium]|nr:hypothetical protein [Burkholderiaceae bacterium]
MTSMSALQPTVSRSTASSTTTQYAGSSRASSGATQAQSASTPQQSTIVTLGTNNQNLAIDPTYSVSAPIWKVRSNDAVSALMGGNFFSSSVSTRLNGLGSALLGMLKDGVDGFTQSVSLASSEAGAITSTGTQQTSYPAAEIKLQIRTQSGVDVEIVLGSENDRLQVQMQSSGDLSEAERTALGDMAAGFQNAIDGLTAKPPVLNLSGLTKFDTKVLSSVDFQSSVTLDKDGPQKLAFHADSTSRSVNVDGPVGSMNVSVDMRDSSIWGNGKQRAAAIDSYLKQFDKAASRGNADKALVGMFKDAFSQMNSDYVAPTQQPKISLADIDHAMLTGLADFKASVKEVTTSPNPKNLGEVDSFAYDASQTTQVGGINQFNRSISQQQQSNLKASYHMSLVPDVPLILTSDNKSQNYYYKQIDDTAQSKVGISYTKGVLSEAYAEQSAKQSTRTSKYELGVLTDDSTTPFNASQKRDILESLKPLLDDLKNEQPSALYNWQQKLLEVHSDILLKSDPADLKSEDWTIPVPQE